MNEDRLHFHINVDQPNNNNNNTSGNTPNEPISRGNNPILGEHIEKYNPLSTINKNQLWLRLTIFVFCLSFLVIGRTNIPDHNIPYLVDRLMDLFNGVNAYILERPAVRDGMLIGCSLFMDIMFFSTGAMWVLKGTTGRVIVSTLIFYFIRAAVQQMFYAPYPKSYYFDDPGFPSLVVPYGKNSDFFFSGHIGFVTICGSEWVTHKNYWVAGLIGLGGIYTAFVLIVYQAHYSIDLFTGILCSHWVYLMVDRYKDEIDSFFVMVYSLIKALFTAMGAANRNEERQILLEAK